MINKHILIRISKKQKIKVIERRFDQLDFDIVLGILFAQNYLIYKAIIMGRTIVQVQAQQENNSGQNEERQAICEEDYELCDEVNSHQQPASDMIQCQQNSKNKHKFKSQSQDEEEDQNQLSHVHHKQKKRRQRKVIAQDQISCKDIIEIIIIIILVIILGISLFRVMFEVQMQYKIEEQRTKGKLRYKDSQLSDYEKLNRKNNPNQNYGQHRQKSTNQAVVQSSANKIDVKKKVQAEVPKVNVSAACASHIWNQLLKNGQLYDFRATHQELKTKSKSSKFNQNAITDIQKEQFSRAIDLVGLIHQTEFKGVLNVKGSPCESAESKRERLERAVNQQRAEWNKEYGMQSYFNRQMRFCVVVNSYNNAKNGLIYRNLDSILQQNYTNYHVVYTDDHSKDNTGQKVKDYLQQKNVPQNLFQLKINQNQKGMMQNIYTAIHEQCKNGEIVVMLDGDDSLVGTNVLALLNAVYQKEKLALMWSNFVTVFNNDQINMGFSRDYPEKNKRQGSFRKVKVFISSHLKTFFVDVFKQINPSDLQTNDGKFYRGASDTAMMLPMLEMANPKIMYLPQILYEYRYDTGQTGNSVNRIPQKEALKKIFGSQPYRKLTDFSFIQKAIDAAIDITQESMKKQPPVQNEIKNSNTPSSNGIAKS